MLVRLYYSKNMQIPDMIRIIVQVCSEYTYVAYIMQHVDCKGTYFQQTSLSQHTLILEISYMRKRFFFFEVSTFQHLNSKPPNVRPYLFLRFVFFMMSLMSQGFMGLARNSHKCEHIPFPCYYIIYVNMLLCVHVCQSKTDFG